MAEEKKGPQEADNCGPRGVSKSQSLTSVPDTALLAGRFMALFSGLQRAHGWYSIDTQRNTDGPKIEGKAVTVREQVTADKWQAHLEGRAGIGIVPVTDAGTCVWGCIDVDQYTGELDYSSVARRLVRMKLPLLCCRSKSGGLHLFCFAAQPVEAGAMQDKLKDVAAMLGFGGSEVFPKQRSLMTDKGECGGWVNMPYQGGDTSTRYSIDAQGDAMSMEAFLAAADAAKAGLEFFTARAGSGVPEPLPGGPPCLQHLVTLGFPQGSRNTALYNLGIYAKKSNPDGFQTQLEEYNRAYMQPPLGFSEVADIVKSLGRKTYGYKCNEHPLAPHCNAALCKTRRFGIGGTGGALPVFGGLTKFDTRPPLYVWDLDGTRLELSTDEITDYYKFSKACFERLDKVLPDLKGREWKEVLAKALETLQVEQVPPEANPDGQLWDLVEAFCRGRTQAGDRDELLLGKPWTNEGRTYFRLQDLMHTLTRKGFKLMNSQRVAFCLKTRGALTHEFKIRGKFVRAWSVPAFADLGPFEVSRKLDAVGF